MRPLGNTFHYILLAILIHCEFSASANSSIGSNNVNLVPKFPKVFETENEACRMDSKAFLDNLNNMTLWAYEIWDSTSKGPYGLLRGNEFQFGDFEECVTAESPFKTKYCLIQMTIHVPPPQTSRDKFSLVYDPQGSVLDKLHDTKDPSRLPRNRLNVGLCVPASCSYQEVENGINIYLKKSGLTALNISYSVAADEVKCQTDRSDEIFSPGEIAYCCVLAIILFLVTLSTLLDSCSSREGKLKSKRSPLLKRCLMSFSARGNFLGLPRADDSNPALNILYGMRTICICLIIVDHRFGTFISGSILNHSHIEYHMRSFASLFIFHGDLFVDSFFVLSGLLVMYGFLTTYEKKPIQAGLAIVSRYVRLTPAYAAVIFYYATILYKTGSGPLWRMIMEREVADCKKNWWTALLYISNYVDETHMCAVHSWYLPCDMHYFILAIPVISLIKKNHRWGLSALFAALVVSVAIPFIVTLAYDLPPLMLFYNEFLTAPKDSRAFRLMYSKSHTRASPYIIGMLTGYAYYRMRNRDEKFSKIGSYLLTIFGAFLLLAGMTTGALYYDPYHSYTPTESALYASLHRVAWAVGTSVLLLNMSYGHMGPLKALFEWSPWVPLSKLTFGAYLIHMQFQIRYVASVKSPQFMSVFDTIYLAFGDLFASFSSALIIYLMFEAPFRKIFREIITPRNTISTTKNLVTLQESIMKQNDSRL